MQNYIYIALGGALGSLTRYWVGAAVANRMGTRFPYGTFIVNITACLFLGFALTLMGKRPEISPALRFLIPIGFVGAYSTFSTFEWETFANLQTGAFLMAELLGANSCILVKNVEGLFDQDPRLNPTASLIEEISAEELIGKDMEDLVLERKTVELLRHAANVRKIKIVNGHKRGNIGQVLANEKVGTVITA